MLKSLTVAPPDPLLSILDAFRSDPRDTKLDLGVGVYRDAAGRTPVMAAVKTAERALLEAQSTKAYVGASGDLEFVRLMGDLALGAEAPERRTGLQTTGGTAALRLAADLLARGGERRVSFVAPTWPNHPPILEAAGFWLNAIPAFDAARQRIDFGRVLDAVDHLGPGDVLLLQASCQNPTGVDFTPDQWDALAYSVAQREVVPLIDAAYLGLGGDLDADAAGLRKVVAEAPLSILALSCSKSFGLYRERTGALIAVSADSALRQAVMSNLLSLARANYSMPPDHGAAVVRTILTAPGLRQSWAGELAGMRERLSGLRQAIAQKGLAGRIDLAPIAAQRGLFSQLPLTVEEQSALRLDHGVYVATGGRINVAGLNEADIPRFAAALKDVTTA